MSVARYPEYKDSGVEWIGTVPAHWKVLRFKTQIIRNDGGVWGDDPDGREDTIVLRSTEQTIDGRWRIEDPALRKLSLVEIEAATLREGDLLLTKSSGSSLHIGKTTLVTREIADLRCCYSNFMQRVRLGESFSSKLAWYVLNNELARLQFDLFSNSSTGLANLNSTLIGNIFIAVPPPEEQSAIAAFLDQETGKIDALVAEQERLIALLKEKRQAVISQAVTKGLNPNAPMKNSGIEWLGQVPAHWRVGKLGHFCNLRSGFAFAAESFGADGVAVVRMNNLKRGRLELAEAARIPEKDCVEAASLAEGDLVWGMSGSTGETGSLGNYARVSADDLPCQLNQRVGRFEIRYEALDTDFLELLIQTNYFYEQIMLFVTGTAQYNVSSGQVQSCIVALPPINQQRQLTAFAKEQLAKFDTLITEATQAITLLRERRAALISAAVTGKIDVRALATSQPEAA